MQLIKCVIKKKCFFLRFDNFLLPFSVNRIPTYIPAHFLLYYNFVGMPLFSLYYFSENEIISAFEVKCNKTKFIHLIPFTTLSLKEFLIAQNVSILSNGYIPLYQFCMQFYPVIDVFGDGIKIVSVSYTVCMTIHFFNFGEN